MKKFYELSIVYSFNDKCCRYRIGISDYYDIDSTRKFFASEIKHTPRFHKKILHLFISLAK